MLPPEASPLETIRELWRAFNRLRKEAHKAEVDQREPGASAGEPMALSSPQVPTSDPAQFERQLQLEAARLETKKAELELIREKRQLKAQEITLQDRKRKTNYWKAVKSGEAPPPNWQQRPAPSPDSSPLIGKSLLQPTLAEVDREGNCLSCGQGIGWLTETRTQHSKNCPGLAK